MHDATALTDDDALVALKFLSHQSDLCLVEITCLDKASGQFTAPNIGSLLGLSQADYVFSWLAISTASQVDSILFTDLYTEKFIKLIRKLKRGPGALKFDATAYLIGSADAVAFYESAQFRAPFLLQIVLEVVEAAQRRHRRFRY